jgi:hypothetical protein
VNQYELATSGDSYERRYYSLFIKDRFSAYELFWQQHVVPLTLRPADIRFKADSELAAIHRNHSDICVAQLHYSILLHLIRAFELSRATAPNFDHVLFGITALCGAQDIAFELLERFEHPNKYDPWLDKKRRGSSILGSKEAKVRWQERNGHPLQSIRDYRNNVVHGRMTPVIVMNNEVLLPKIGHELDYLDWRKVMNLQQSGKLPTEDYQNAGEILKSAWTETTDYLENQWRTNLLPRVPRPSSP